MATSAMFILDLKGKVGFKPDKGISVMKFKNITDNHFPKLSR